MILLSLFLSFAMATGTPEVDAAATATACPVSVGDAQTVTVLEPGSGSMNLLRFEPTLGTKDTYNYTLTQKSKTYFRGAQQGSDNAPPITIVLDTEVTANDGDTFTIDFEFKSVDVGTSLGVSETNADQLADMLALIVGVRGKSTLTNRGFVLNKSIDLKKDASIEVQKFATSYIENLLMQVAVSLPAEPVGVGARWKAESKVEDSGITHSQVAVFTIKSLESGRAVMDVKVTRCAADQKLKGPQREVTVQTMKTKGQGTTTISFSGPLPIKSAMNANVVTKMTLEMLGETLKMLTDVEQGSTLQAGQAIGD